MDKKVTIFLSFAIIMLSCTCFLQSRRIDKLHATMLHIETQHAIQMEALMQRVQAFEMTVTGKIESQVSPPSWVLEWKK